MLSKASNPAAEGDGAARRRLLRSRKMETVGKLAGGVAHEINNPLGFIHSNFNSLKRYLAKFAEFDRELTIFLSEAPTLTSEALSRRRTRIMELRAKLKIDYLMDDLRQLIDESQEGAERIRKIVAGLKDFARADDAGVEPTDLNARLESVLGLTWNELKYKCALIKDYGELPLVPCCSGDVDQVFLNVLLNAAQATVEHGEIRIRTWSDGEHACVAIGDNAGGIAPELLPHIFEPRQDDQPLAHGLSIAHNIIQQHCGDMQIESLHGVGTTVTIKLRIANYE